MIFCVCWCWGVVKKVIETSNMLDLNTAFIVPLNLIYQDIEHRGRQSG